MDTLSRLIQPKCIKMSCFIASPGSRYCSMADTADTKQDCLTIFQLQLTEILYSFIDSFYTYAYLIIHIWIIKIHWSNSRASKQGVWQGQTRRVQLGLRLQKPPIYKLIDTIGRQPVCQIPCFCQGVASEQKWISTQHACSQLASPTMWLLCSLAAVG